jgi:hypothetical protein
MKEKPRKVTAKELLEIFDVEEIWQIDPLNMGWCKDGCTKWYTYETPDGEVVYWVKH